eukprot:374083-Prorocentrum_lima.AAC.1
MSWRVGSRSRAVPAQKWVTGRLSPQKLIRSPGLAAARAILMPMAAAWASASRTVDWSLSLRMAVSWICCWVPVVLQRTAAADARAA